MEKNRLEAFSDGVLAIVITIMILELKQPLGDGWGDLYAFLYRADNLDSDTWEKGIKDHLLSNDERLKILDVAFEIAKRV